MSHVLTIARREIRERSFVFLAAAALAVAPYAAMLVPTGSLTERINGSATLGLIIGTAFVVGLGILLGVSLIGREAREKRLSFYFARPVSASSIWFGKLIAGLVLIGGSALILFTSGFVILDGSWRGSGSMTVGVLLSASLVAAIVALLLVHAGATMLRSRTAWIALDVVALAVFVATSVRFVVPLLFHGAVQTASVVLLGGASLFLLAIALGGAWQLERGRIDARRSHRELSMWIWSAAALILAGIGIAAAVISSTEIGDLDDLALQNSGSDRVALVAGNVKGHGDYYDAFLLDVASGRSERVPFVFDLNGEVSQDGSAAAWIEPRLGRMLFRSIFSVKQVDTGEIVMRRLRGGRTVRTGAYVSVMAKLGFSQDGKRLGVIDEGTVSVFEVESGRSLGAAKLPAEARLEAFEQYLNVPAFFGNELRVHLTTGARGDDRHGIVVYAFDPSKRSLRTLLDVDAAAVDQRGPVPADPKTRRMAWVVPAPDGTAVLAHFRRTGSERFDHIAVFDLATRQPRFSAATAPNERFSSSWILTDGRVAVAVANADTKRVAIRLYSREGALTREMPLPHEYAVMRGQASPSHLVVMAGEHGNRATHTVDLESGRITQSIDGLMPSWIWGSGGASSSTNPVIAVSNRKSVVAWNALTGERRTLVGR